MIFETLAVKWKSLANRVWVREFNIKRADINFQVLTVFFRRFTPIVINLWRNLASCTAFEHFSTFWIKKIYDLAQISLNEFKKLVGYLNFMKNYEFYKIYLAINLQGCTVGEGLDCGQWLLGILEANFKECTKWIINIWGNLFETKNFFKTIVTRIRFFQNCYKYKHKFNIDSRYVMERLESILIIVKASSFF